MMVVIRTIIESIIIHDACMWGLVGVLTHD